MYQRLELVNNDVHDLESVVTMCSGYTTRTLTDTRHAKRHFMLC